MPNPFSVDFLPLQLEPHAHVLFSSWRRGQEYVSRRCCLCDYIEYEPIADSLPHDKGFWERAYGPPEYGARA